MSGLRQWFRKWLEETHSAQFELCRHFFQQFFESEFVTAPGQMKLLVAGALSILLSLSILFGQAYYAKYLALKSLEDPRPYYLAILADVTFLVVCTMLLTGLFTTLLWPSLFPGLRDYLALAGLPLKMRQIFTAKFAALLLFAGLVIAAIALMPAIVLPYIVRRPRGASMFWQIPGIFISCTASGFFIFLSLVALQGVLLNLLPVRYFQRVSLTVQAALLTTFLCALPFAISIPRLAESMALRPSWAVWAPPLWFLGLDQVIFGNTEPMARELARRALVGVALAAAGAVLTYVWSYRRQRVRVLESPGGEGRSPRDWAADLASRLISSPRTLATFAFTAKTLARSRQHRLILTAFVGLALALIAEAAAGIVMGGSFPNGAALRTAAIAVPLAVSLFTLAGFRYLFRLPVELRANWIFRIHEPGRAPELLAGAERYLIVAAVLPVALLTLPAELYMLGARAGVLAALLSACCSLCLVEVLLFTFDRIPFTSAYLPGRHPMFQVVLGYGAAVTLYVSMLSALLSWCTDSLALSSIAAILLLSGWWKLRLVRLEIQQASRLEFEELEEPVVRRLEIERD